MAARSAPVHLRLIAARLNRDGSDRDLLREFVQHRSQSAFAELVRRYGAMVFGVCRRALRHDHDAEDAFQATFLVLARRAARISAPEKLPGWLHRVAVRTATEIRHMRDRRQLVNPDRKGGGDPAKPDRERGGDVLEQRELAAALDAELAALPDHYRLPVVLCELRGLSRKQAADELGIPEGTLSSRLAKARKLLAERLSKRGFAASVAVVSATLANTASARIPERLTLLAVESAVGASGSVIAPTVSLATDTVVKALFASKLKGLVLAGGLFLAMAGGVLLVPGGAGAQTGGDGPVRTTEKADPAEAWVKQLGSKDFAEREAAEKKLKELGAKALAAVKAGLKSDVPEVVERCERLLPKLREVRMSEFRAAFLADKEPKQAFDHPVWKRFVAMVGDSKPSRDLFARIIAHSDWASALDVAEESPARAAEHYQEAVRQIGERQEANSRVFFMIPIWPCDQPEEVAFLLLLGSCQGTDPAGVLRFDTPADRWFASGEGRIRFGRGLKLAFQGKRLDIDPKKGDRSIEVNDGSGDAVGSERVMLTLLGHWLERRNLWAVVAEHLKELSADQQQRLLPFARRVLADDNAPVLCRATWVSVVRRFGEPADAALLTKLFADRTGMDWPSASRYGDGPGNLINQAEVREVAIGSAHFLHGRDPADHGFTGLTNQTPRKKRTDDIHSTLFCVAPTGTPEDKAKVLTEAANWITDQEQTAEKLVRQLGSKDFAERESAEKKLKELGAKAYEALSAGLKSDVPEIAERCSKVFPAVHAAWLTRPESELWKRFTKIAGDDKPARELFAEMVSDTRRAEVLQSATANPDTAGKQYRDELNRGIKALRDGYDEAERRNRGRTGLNHPASGIPTRGELVALFFLGTFASTADVKPDADDRWQDGLHANLFSYGLSRSVAGNPNEIPIFDGEKTSLPEPVRKLLAAWLGVRRDPQMIQHGFGLVKSHGVQEALPAARAVAADKTYATKERAAALLAVGMFGDAKDMKLVEPLFDCTDEFHSTNYTYPGGQKVSLVTQVRDAAYGVAVKLNGGEPADYGFELCVEYKTRGNQVFQARYSFGFRSDEARAKAHEQVKAFLKVAPVPVAKAVLPKKLGKVPDPSPELGKELFQIDENYRHGTPEKFAELEKKVEELAKQYPEKDDQARIWYEVAHVAAQSDIRKQAERVKKYAARCLEMSRDPLQRATLYSYLASAEEVNDGAFAERRKKATDWLLRGYLELLAQELPDEKPELPAAVRMLGESPQARARNAAAMAAIMEARFVQDQVFRRDVLVQQLRGLFKSDPDELKALAAKKLPDDLAVKELMKRVMK